MNQPSLKKLILTYSCQLVQKFASA